MLKVCLPLNAVFEFENASVLRKDQGGFTLRIAQNEPALSSFRGELIEPRNMLLEVDGQLEINHPVKLIEEKCNGDDWLGVFRFARNVSGVARDGYIVAPPLK